MASIHKDILLDAHPSDVWAAVRDFGNPHQRLVPGFVIDARLDDDARQRLVYAINKFHAEGLKAGGRDNGGAGPRADYSPTYFAAFLIDPDGNNVEAVCT